MRSCRVNLPNRCYHLISRVAHRAFFLDEGERTRLVSLIRRVAKFSGVDVLAYSVMSNHFHLFVYIGYPEPLGDAEIVRRIAALYSDVRFELEMKKWNELARTNRRPDRRGKCYAAGLETPGYVPQVVDVGDNVLAVRLMQLLQWEPKPPAYLRTTLGIASREYFTKAYLRPLTETGLIARTDPDHPNSPRQKYALTAEGRNRIGRVAPL